MNAKNFPQIYRRINAFVFNKIFLTARYLIISLFLILIFLNFHSQLFPENEEYTKLKLETLKSPQSYLAFTNLAFYLNNHGLAHEANYYFQVAQTIFNNQYRQSLKVKGEVLGAKSPFTLYQEIIGHQEEIKRKVDYWQEVTQKLPNFRDGYLQLGLGFYRLGRFEEAKKAINTALIIDPRYPQKNIIEKLILK